MLFTTAGTYHYVVKEKADPNKPYYQYDTTNYEVTVTVTAGNKNSLTASASVKKVGVDGTTDAVDFTNTYTAEGTSVQFSGTKTISGIESTDKVFSFSLYETGEDYVVAEGAEALRTASTSGIITGSQAISFDAISYDEEGTHYYVIREDALSSADGFTIDSKAYKIQVEVTDNGEGQLVANVTGDAAANAVNFTNTYKAEGTSVQFSGTKTISGIESTDKVFSFELYQTGEEHALGEGATPLQTASTSGRIEGSQDVTFSEITYESAGEYYYVIKEKALEEADGFMIDSRVYEITVTVMDDEKGQLVAEISGDAARDEINFTNHFNGSVRLTKTDGASKFLAGAQFQLFAEQDDSSYAVYSSAVSENGLYETDENGVLEVTNLPAGNYYFVETRAPKGYVISTDDQGQPVRYLFRVEPGTDTASVELTVSNESGTEGSISVTKRTTMFDGEDIVDVAMKDATFHVGIFTDAAGTQPYGTDYVKEIRMSGQSVSETVVFSGLETGTYYILETDASGNPIPLETMQTEGELLFTCRVDGEGTNAVELDLSADIVEGSVNLNNLYYDLPSGYYMEGQIDITKNVLVGGERTTVNDVFYAGIFTEDGALVRVVELVQNGIVSVPVALGGENGTDPVTYYVQETDVNGTPVNKQTFAYEVSGEGSVSLDVDNTIVSIAIINELIEEEVPTEEPTEEPTETEPDTKPTDTNSTEPTTTTSTKATKTGDTTNLTVELLLLVLAAVIMGTSVYARKRRRNRR